MTDNTSLLNQAHVHYQCGTGGSTVEKPAETQTSIWLASHLVRAPNSISEGHEFESPMRLELDALTKKWKDPWGQVFLHAVHNGRSCNACVRKRNCFTQQISHKIILLHNSSMTRRWKLLKCNVVYHVMNNIGFPMKGKLRRSNSVLVCVRFRIRRYVAPPPGQNMTPQGC